jgi:hypothetical protein
MAFAARAFSRARFVQEWLKDPATYPVIGVSLFGAANMTYFSVRALYKNDVFWTKKERAEGEVHPQTLQPLHAPAVRNGRDE